RSVTNRAAAVPAWSATSNDLRNSSSSWSYSQPSSQGIALTCPEEEIGSSSAGPWRTPSRSAWRTGRVVWSPPALLAESIHSGARARGANPPEHDVGKHQNKHRDRRVVGVLEVSPPALPVASDPAPE